MHHGPGAAETNAPTQPTGSHRRARAATSSAAGVAFVDRVRELLATRRPQDEPILRAAGRRLHVTTRLQRVETPPGEERDGQPHRSARRTTGRGAATTPTCRTSLRRWRVAGVDEPSG